MKGGSLPMKKCISILLCLSMLIISACAFAEAGVITYDPAMFEALGIETNTLELEDFGLVFDLPDTMLEIELSEADLAGGTIAAFSLPDGSQMMSIGFAQMLDMGGQIFEDYDALITYYQMYGATDLEIVDVNGLYALSYAIAEANVMGSLYLFDDGWVLAFNFAPLADADYVPVAASIMSSVRPAE